MAKTRRGISLTEVLISMFVLLIGLMGVAAMFPVGSYYMVKGEQRDRAAAVAQAAANEAVTRGFLDPSVWLEYNPASSTAIAPVFPVYPPVNAAQPIPAVGYVIDPLAMAAAASQGIPLQNVRRFPHDSSPHIGSPVRVTLPVAGGGMMPAEIADLIFRSRDDLAFEIPERADQPARLLFDDFDHDNDAATPPVPLRRQTLGEYSWIVTIAPCYSFEPKYQQMLAPLMRFNYLATARDPSLEHKVSVVVFHRRDLLFPTGTGAETELNERQVVAEVLSSGFEGGEVRLRADDDPNELNGMRAGEWVLMFGQYPLDETLAPAQRRWFMEWYQIVTMDLAFDETATGTPGTRIVSLKGPRWPYSASDVIRMSNGDVPAELLPRVGLVKGAISVHTKTMRLESPTAWSIP